MIKKLAVFILVCIHGTSIFCQSKLFLSIEDERYLDEHVISLEQFTEAITKVLKKNDYLPVVERNHYLTGINITVHYLNFYQSSAKTMFGKGIIDVEVNCPSDRSLNEKFRVSVDIPFEDAKLKKYQEIEFRGDKISMEEEVTLHLAERAYEKIEKQLALAFNSPNVSNTYASNPGHQNKPSQTTIDSTLEKLEQRVDYALIIAIDEYTDFSNLVNPINDAKTIEAELKNNYGFQTEIISNPTKTEVLMKLREYGSKKYHPDNQLFIFFAGHGIFDEVFGEGYLVCKDSKTADEIMDSYISHSNLRTIVNNIPCNHIFLSMDVCFGGTFDPLIASSERGQAGIYTNVSRTEFIERKLQYTTRRYLTSGGKEYVPDGRPGQHSPFARRFIEALRGYGGDDRILTLNEVLMYIEKVNPQPRYGEFGRNQPGSDFIFIAR